MFQFKKNDFFTHISFVILLIAFLSSAYFGCGCDDSKDLQKQLAETINTIRSLEKKANRIDELEEQIGWLIRTQAFSAAEKAELQRQKDSLATEKEQVKTALKKARQDLERLRQQVQNQDPSISIVVTGLPPDALERIGAAVKEVMDKYPGYPRPQLSSDVTIMRVQPKFNLTTAEVKHTFVEKNIYDGENNPKGRGVDNQFTLLTSGVGNKIVFDQKTRLIWQQSGSNNPLPYTSTTEYINALNTQKFAGLTHWRLPTLEEAMTLMEPPIPGRDVSIDRVFNSIQERVWTADTDEDGQAWIADFGYGTSYSGSRKASKTYMRAVNVW